jgi:hypothetical protein
VTMRSTSILLHCCVLGLKPVRFRRSQRVVLIAVASSNVSFASNRVVCLAIRTAGAKFLAVRGETAMSVVTTKNMRKTQRLLVRVVSQNVENIW